MWKRIFYGLIAAFTLIAIPLQARAGNGANFVLYNHHTGKKGEIELMVMNDIGEEPDGTRYAAQMLEFEMGLTDRLSASFMIEGQSTFGEAGYNFTGFRLEGRYRLFDYGSFLNPVLYVEYEDLSVDTRFIMEISGREDASTETKKRDRERVLETRIIVGSDFGERLNVAFNWLNESDLDTGVTSFGYAAGINYRVNSFHSRDKDNSGSTLGVEFFGAVGNNDKGLTLDSGITQHYFGINMSFPIGEDAMIKFGGAVGLTNVSQDIFRLAYGYEF